MTFSVSKFRGLLFAASIATVIDYLMQLSSTVIAGHQLGEKALAGTSLLQSPTMALSFIATMFALGGTILYSNAMGVFDTKRAKEVFSCGLLATAGAGLLLALLMFLCKHQYMAFFNADADIEAFASAYWNGYLFVALTQGLCLYLVNMINVDGDKAIGVCCHCTRLLVTASVSWFLCRRYGIIGCALGCAIGNVVAIAVLCLHFFKKTNSFHFCLFFSFRDIYDMCRGSLGDASVPLCWAVLAFFMNKFIIARFGAEYMAVLAAVQAATGFTIIFDGIGNAIQPLVGVYAGERNFRSVRAIANASFITALCEGGALALVLLVYPGIVLHCVGISDPTLVSAAMTAVRIIGSSFVFWAIVFLFNSFYLFVDHAMLACVITALKDLFCPMCLLAIGGVCGGLTGMWIGYACGAPVALVLFFGGVFLKYGKDMFPFLVPRDRDKLTFVYNLTLSETSICAVSASVAKTLEEHGIGGKTPATVSLLVEETLMVIKDRNGNREVMAEATLDLNDGISLVLRDDGVIFDITDVDARISSLRTYLVASLMEGQKERRNLTTTGFNRNAFLFDRQ